MRVAINCRSFLNKKYTGIGRYAYNLVKSLSEIDNGNQYLLYVRKKLFDPKRRTPQIPAQNFSLKIDYFNNGLDKTLGGVDVYHSPSPEKLLIEGPKIIVTIHDLIHLAYPQGHTSATIEATQRHMQEIVKKSAKIICCSQNTADDLKKYFDVSADKIRVIHQGVDKNIFYPLSGGEQGLAQDVLRARAIQEPFILFVGTLEPRKNLNNLLRAFFFLKERKKFSGKLVIVGMKGWMGESAAYFIEHLGLKNDVICLGYVTDEELRVLYNKAQVFVFPSFYEGFGFPIVEAFSCGAAVITSNGSSCAEVAGEAALTVDPYQPKEIADAMAKILEDKDLSNILKQKALKRAEFFSFRKTAEETLQVYRQVAGAS